MSQVTNLAFFRARRGQSEALGAALAALVEPTRLEGCVLRWASINRRRARCPKPLRTSGGSPPLDNFSIGISFARKGTSPEYLGGLIEEDEWRRYG